MAVQANNNDRLDKAFNPTNFPKQKWIEQNTAILVAHGIGQQKPLETLDMFTRPLLKSLFEYGEHDENDFTATHLLKPKHSDSGGTWYDNVIRITKSGSPYYLDIYELYWAYEVGERVSLRDIQEWVNRTAEGAKDFYEQAEFGKDEGDSSPFFRHGEFQVGTYRAFLSIAGILLPMAEAVGKWIVKVSRLIPYVGNWIAKRVEGATDALLGEFTAYVGDVVAYNTDDPNRKHYEIRRNILNDAVRAIRYLIEPDEHNQRAYQGVLIAAHSLGTEITFDALNRINHLATQGALQGITKDGNLTATNDKPGDTLEKLLLGFVTFGCPLDKIAFFFRDRSAKDAYLRAQMLRDFHSFKQHDWKPSGEVDAIELHNNIPRLFNNIPWRNYYDGCDPVSGRLDFYGPLTNLDCTFFVAETKEWDGWLTMVKRLRQFSHNKYWDHGPMYGDFLSQLVLK